MEIIEKEAFAFAIINQLYDEFDLHINDYTLLCKKTQEANTHKEIDSILQCLKGSLLIVMKEKID